MSDDDDLSKRRFDEFDCPDCDATNPYDDKFGHGDEVLCFYCGNTYEVRVNDSGKLKLRSV